MAIISGETTRKGFYVYDDKRKANPDPELKKYIQKAREISGVNVDPKVLSLLLCSLVVEHLGVSALPRRVLCNEILYHNSVPHSFIRHV